MDDLSIPEMGLDPLTVGYLMSCLEDIPPEAIIIRIETRASRIIDGFGDEEIDEVIITTDDDSYGFC